MFVQDGFLYLIVTKHKLTVRHTWPGSWTQVRTGFRTQKMCVFCLPFPTVLEFFKQSIMGVRNQVGIGLSYRPARLHRLPESIPYNQFLDSSKFKNSSSGFQMKIENI
jgi:hypothetical protein